MKKSYIIIPVLCIAGIITFTWYTLPITPALTACTMEAKLCPNGSSVGRTGPNCEFAACPTTADNNWKTFTDTARDISFTYPNPLPAKYISTQEWPPKITVVSGALTCTKKKIINNTVYCVTAVNEGAAGSTYTTYSYATEKDGKIITMSFVLRAVQCMNYDDPQQTECLKERAAFNVDTLADKILRNTQL